MVMEGTTRTTDYCFDLVHSYHHSFARNNHLTLVARRNGSQYIYPVIANPSIPTYDKHFLYPALPLSRPPAADSRRSHNTRSLTIHNHNTAIYKDMALENPPSSPPGLSSSRSSTKSSSLHSSSLPGHDLTDFSHFEEISLSEMHRSSPPRQVQRANKPRPLLRPNHTTPTPRPNKSATNLRDVSNGLRASVAINNHVRAIEAQRSPLSPNGQPLPRPLVIPPRPNRRNPPSPRLAPPSPRLPTSPRLLRSHTDGPTIPSRPHRPISQAPRKTAKELEAEYNDEDDELPEDAFITNIPISPRPMHERSRSTSPEHPSLNGRSRSVAGVDAGRPRSWDEALSDLSIEARDLTFKLETHANSLGRRHSADQNASKPTSSPPQLQHSKTIALPPLQRGDIMIDPLPASKEKEKLLTRTRPSWLPPKCQKEERKHLKEYQKMMYTFAENERRKSAESDKQFSTSPKAPRDKDTALRAWRHVLGDWDAALQRPQTRELWWKGIPPALRGQVWARAIGNDLQLSSTSFRAALSRAKVVEQRLVDASVGGQHRGHTRQVSVAENRADQRTRRSLKTLDLDIATGAFPALGLFQQGQPRHRALRDLLLAYAAYREDTGHVRGTAAIAVLLLLQSLPNHPASTSAPPSPVLSSRKENIPSTAPNDKQLPPTPPSEKPTVEDAATSTAFVALANLLNRPLSLAFCINDTAAKDRTFRHITKAMRTKLPKLEEHFSALVNALPREVGWNDLLAPLCQSLLTSHLAVEDVARVWDVMVLEGDGVVVRGVVAALARLEPGLYGGWEEVLGVLDWPQEGEGNGSGMKAKARIEGGGASGADEVLEWVRWAGREEESMPVRSSRR